MGMHRKAHTWIGIATVLVSAGVACAGPVVGAINDWSLGSEGWTLSGDGALDQAGGDMTLTFADQGLGPPAPEDAIISTTNANFTGN